MTPWYGDRITCICAKDSNGERFERTDEEEQKIIYDFFAWLTKRPADEYSFVTYNGKEFDIPFILARQALTVDLNKPNGLFLLDYQHIDLYQIVKQITGKRMGLDTVARLLGCTPKNGTGTKAIELWKAGELDKLKEYCMNYVLVTEEVYHKLK